MCNGGNNEKSNDASEGDDSARRSGGALHVLLQLHLAVLMNRKGTVCDSEEIESEELCETGCFASARERIDVIPHYFIGKSHKTDGSCQHHRERKRYSLSDNKRITI